MKLEKELDEYFDILCDSDYPRFIDKYLELDELRRLDGIGQFCGCDYTKLHDIKYWYSRLHHSIATSLMTWKFTHDKKQTIAALLHDLGTPAFSHCIDYLMGDSIEQKSSEKSVYEIILSSDMIKEYLEYDNIKLDDIKDLSLYSIVENERPKICVDRLDGILHTCLIWQQYWKIEDIQEVYNDMTVLINEDGKEEIGFKTKTICEKFFDGAYKYSMVLQQNEDKYAMQYIADVLKKMIKNQKISLEQLYILSEKEIVDLIKINNNSWSFFESANCIERTEDEPEAYFVSIESKKRYAIPLCLFEGKVHRLNDISECCKDLLKNYLEYKDSKYAYVKGIKKI